MNLKREQIKTWAEQLQQLVHKLSRIENLPIRVDEGVEISTREAHTIQVIGENAPLCVQNIASRFGVSKSAASQMVSKLAHKGFIDKRPSAHSNKELQLSLTSLGRLAFQAHEQAHGSDMNRISKIMESFSSAELATLSKFLKAFEDIADERLNNK